MEAIKCFVRFTVSFREIAWRRAWKWGIDRWVLLFCILLTLACVPVALATPPRTPIELQLAISPQPPRFAEWVTVNVTVNSIFDAPDTSVELILPEGTVTQTRSWTVDLTANVPVSLTSDVLIEKTGNLTVAARALKRINSDTVWGDMKAVPFYIGPIGPLSLSYSPRDQMGWNTDTVPMAVNTIPGNAKLISMEPSLFPTKERLQGGAPNRDRSLEPSIEFRAADTARSSLSPLSSPGTTTLTGKWQYHDRSQTPRDIDRQLVEIRKGDFSELSPRAFCFTIADGSFSCSFAHPGTTIRVQVWSWTNLSIPGGTADRLGVFSGPEVTGGCGSDARDCSYPVFTGEISCTDGATCDVGTWPVNALVTGEPWLGAHQMTQDLIRSWTKLQLDSRHPTQFLSAGPARIDYPVPSDSGHSTRARVGNGEFDGWIWIQQPDQLSADVVTHEYGHVVMSNLWTNYSPKWPKKDCPDSGHQIENKSGPGCALSEGFADFWSWYSNEFYDGDNSTLNDGPIWNFASGATRNLETRGGGTFQMGDQVEGNVAAAFGDIFDRTNEDTADSLSDGISHIWHTIASKSYNNFSEWWTAYWSTFGHDPCPALDILRFNTILYDLSQCWRTLGVTSTSSGINITVRPTDKNGQRDGIAPFERMYDHNRIVTLTAPVIAEGKNFQMWRKDGLESDRTVSTQVRMDTDHGMTAVYVTPSIEVIFPNGNNALSIGTTHKILWSSTGVRGNAIIQLSRNGGGSWTTIFDGVANDGNQNWTVTGPATTRARIRICSVRGVSVCDTSDANFIIR